MALSKDMIEQGKAGEALRDAEEFLRRLIVSSQDCVKVLDLQGRLLWMNEGGMQALEICELGPFVNSSWIQFWEGEDAKAAQAAVEAAGKGGTSRFTGYFATTTTKQPKWWDVVVSPIRNAEGEPERLLVVSRDVTEHKRNEKALREAHLQVARSEERWRSVFENSAIGVALTDLNGRFLAANPVYQKMVGYGEDELRALSFLEITHADYREANWTLAAELLEGKRQQFQIEKQYRRKDGSLVWVSNNVSLVPGTETMPRFIMALSEDITERKRAEEALHNSEERVRLILDSTAEGIFGCDPEGTCLFCNPAAVRLLGYDDSSELLGKNMHALEHHTRADGRPYPIEECPIYAGFQNGQGVHRDDEVFWRRDGTCFPVEFWSHPVFQESKTLGAVVTFVDITERKQAEDALRKSEQLKRRLLEINNAIITNLTEEALLRSIFEAVRSSIPLDRCAITLYVPETDTIRFLAVEGDLRSDYFQRGLEVSRTETSAGWVFDHQRPLRRNLEEEPQFANERRLWAEGLRSVCAVPLILRGKSIGTLSVVSRAKDAYSEEDAQFLQEVAIQVALAIENMKFYEEIATLKARLEKENIYLREEIRSEHNFEEIVGNSPALLAVLRVVEQVAPTDSAVLIYGETGTGKELIARAIHNRSARKDRALVSVNCSAISAGLVESELFGHLRGAFTGAFERRIGRFELANGGTIFLDEIGELPLETQVKLLRVLQEHEFEPVGSSHTQRVDVRVIAATNRNLREMVEAGRFRSDLFYRLNVFPLELPPLRERRSDIPQLVALCVSRFAKRSGKKVEGVSQETMARLMSYPWPGNIRELQNVMERAVVLSTGPILRLDKDLVPVIASEGNLETAEILAQETQPAAPSPSGLPTLEEVERSHILAALKHAGEVVDGPKGAARILNLHPNTLRHRMSKLGIKRSAHRQS
jgi:formate hydrogenlyase transcriptional activator